MKHTAVAYFPVSCKSEFVCVFHVFNYLLLHVLITVKRSTETTNQPPERKAAFLAHLLDQ